MQSLLYRKPNQRISDSLHVRIYLILLSCFVATVNIHLNAQSFEQKLGKQTFEMVKQSQGLYENEKALQLVIEVGRDLEKLLTLPEPLTYYLVDVSEPNAFATAGGYVFVTRGLLALINSRDELAGVMAHEISHVTQHHVKKQVHASILPLVLELPGNIIGALTYKEIGNIINLPIEVPSELILKSYSRKHENEADEKGVDLAAKAGYDPYALGVILERLDKYVEALTGQAMHRSLMLDHPLTESRVKNLTQHLSKRGYQAQPYKTGTDLLALDDVIYGQNPTEGYIHENKFLQIQLGLYCEFPEKWIIQNSPVSVTAISPEKKASIVVSVDAHEEPAKVAAAEELKSINPSSVLLVKDTIVNGLNAVYAKIQNTKSKSATHLSEVLWIRLPDSKVLLKIVGLTDIKNPDPSVAKSLGSFRALHASDFSHLSYYKIKLRPIEEIKLLDTYINSKGVQLINGYKSGDELPNGKQLKIIESYPLSGY